MNTKPIHTSPRETCEACTLRRAKMRAQFEKNQRRSSPNVPTMGPPKLRLIQGGKK